MLCYDILRYIMISTRAAAERAVEGKLLKNKGLSAAAEPAAVISRKFL